MDTGKHRTMQGVTCLALAVITALAFRDVLHNEFINFDDQDYVTENVHVRRGLTLPGVIWAFTHCYSGNWHPLTWIAHMIDCQLFGLNAGAHHAVNLAIHIANALLLFLVFNKITGAIWRSAMVAGLFALHPMHVESVAWVAERKDTLSTFFFLLTIAAYFRYAQKKSKAEGQSSETPAPAGVRGGRPWVRDYSLALVCFALGLMVKPMLVTVPFVLLLLDGWPLKRFTIHDLRVFSAPGSGGRLAISRLVVEKIPFFILTALSSVITFYAQKSGGAVMALEHYSVPSRIGNASLSYLRYIGKMIWPVDLAVTYPLAPFPIWLVLGAVVVLFGLTLAFIAGARRRPYLWVGWFWYLGTLVPVIGVVQVGRQAFADRYSYIPLIGLFIIVVWGIADLISGWKQRKLWVAMGSALVLLLCAFGTARQVQYWKNSLILFGRAVAVTKNNALAQNNFAASLAASGRKQEAFAHYSEAVRIEPRNAMFQNNFGTALSRAGDAAGAMSHYLQAIQLNPKYAEAYNNVGTLLSNQGQSEAAIEYFRRALALNPDYAEAYNNLGGVLALRGKPAEAVPNYEKAIRLKPEDPTLHFNLGLARLKLGQMDEAIARFTEVVRLDPGAVEGRVQLGRCLFMKGQVQPAGAQFSEALRLKPDHADAQFYLGLARLSEQKTEPAISHLREAVRLRPGWAEPLNALAWVLATDPDERLRNGGEAVRLAEQAAGLTRRQEPVFLNTLAAAYAEAGRFDEAIATASEALDVSRKSNQTGLLSHIQAGLELYQAHRPFRQNSPRQ